MIIEVSHSKIRFSVKGRSTVDLFKLVYYSAAEKDLSFYRSDDKCSIVGWFAIAITVLLWVGLRWVLHIELGLKIRVYVLR